MSTLFSSGVKNIFNEQRFDSYSLVNILQDLIKVFPQNFEISTNNGKHRFNKDLVELLIPNINDAINENEALREYHFDINDEQNVMQKIESLFKGESVEFLNSEENTIKQITSFFVNGIFPIQMLSIKNLMANMPHIHHTNEDFFINQAKFPEKMTIQINFPILFGILKDSPRTFKIKTNQNEYLCNSFGIFASRTILSYLETHPTSNEYYFDFNEENKEFKLIIDFFNLELLQFTPDTANTILCISEDLAIDSLIGPLNFYIQKVEETADILNKNQAIIDPYDELFEKLINIKEIGVEKTADFIAKSEWAKTKTDVQELVACILLVSKTKLSVVDKLAELVQVLSGKEGALNELAPFLIQRLLSTIGSNSNLCAFLYHMLRLNFVSIEKITKRILMKDKQDGMYRTGPPDQYLWLLPEIYTEKIFSRNRIISYLSGFLSKEQIKQVVNSDELLEETISKIRIFRENCGQKDQLIQSIKNDDIDTFQKIVSFNSINVHKKEIKLTVFDGIQNEEISFIDYSAFCGSLKCFKYLFLEKVPISFITLCYAIKGGNTEIIHILDQNKDRFVKKKFSIGHFYYQDANPILAINSAIEYYHNDIFDWLLENLNDRDSNLESKIFNTAVSVGNAHAISRVVENGFNICLINTNNLCHIISSTCANGLYRILLFMSKFISFSDIFDPSKNDTNVEKCRRLLVQKTYTDMMNDSITFGNVKIFDLLFESMKVKYSFVINKVLIEAVKSGKIDIVKHFLDNKIYELSDTDLVQAICCSIESGYDELIDYFIGQKKDFPLTTTIISSACASKNIKIVKSLIQMANEKEISIDFTVPFLNAALSQSEEIIKLLIDLKVDINYNNFFEKFNEIININPSVIFLLFKEIKPELKGILILESYNAALSTNNIEILKFLMTNKYEFEDLLIKAVEVSNLEVIKTILEINHSVEFINKIGKFGTALFQAVRNTSNIKIYVTSSQKPQIENIIKSKHQIIEYLLSLEGIDPSISVDSINTPLVEAVRINNVEAFDLILNFYGDNIKNQGKQIHDALRVILNNQSERIKKKMESKYKFGGIGSGVNNSKDPPVNKEQIIFNKLLSIRNLANAFMQEDVLYYAIMENAPDIVERLLNDESINIRHRIDNGDTYLHLAIEGCSVTPIQRLILNHKDIDINSSNAFKETPLIKAVKFKNKELIKLIMNHPKFDASLSLLDYAFMLSVKSKYIFMILIKAKSLDVNYFHVCQKPNDNKNDTQYAMQNNTKNEGFTTPLIEATKTGNLEIIKAIIGHQSFDPNRSHITSCLFIAIQKNDLNLFKFFLELNNVDINIKNMENRSPLFVASSSGNSVILNEILSNQKFDPVKSNIQDSFINSINIESMKILVSYDEEHGKNFLSFDKIYLLSKLDSFENRFRSESSKYQNAIEFLLRKKGLLPVIPSICTSVLEENHRVYQRFFKCKTCGIFRSICEICARVCHKGHIIIEDEGNFTSTCSCDHKCKCKSIVESVNDELYDTLNVTKIDETKLPSSYQQNKKKYFDEDEDENEVEYNGLSNMDTQCIEKENEIKSLKCTFDLSGFQPMLQPMYRCRKCKVDICQSCAIVCHKGHPLNFKGIKSNSSCLCFNKTNCLCTSRKDVVCTYAFYGEDYIDHERYKCITCGTGKNEGVCTTCAKKCHHGHQIYFDRIIDHFCDCGASVLQTPCKALEFPPFNYLSSCTNREQKYQLLKQRLYHCKTCGITAQNQGICEACALLCHPAHKVVFVGTCDFVCECVTMNKCIAHTCPEILCEGLCSRAKETKDKLFPALVCFTCDIKGEMKFCKSCALNCHKEHDVHFLEYSNSTCQCNPCKCYENKS